MTEDACTATSSSYVKFSLSSDTSHSRKRRKRKWDQPAVSNNDAVFAAVPPSSSVSLIGTPVNPLLTNLPVACWPTNAPILKFSSIPQNGVCVVPKLNQTKDDLVIAREIIINDADSATRHRLTKRQTQEEILKCTGAFVITRGRYHPPNALPNNEKPLYLHIYCGAHIKDTSERILAVDHAAALIEEMLKQGRNLPLALTCQMEMVNGEKALSKCVFLPFDADPSSNIASKIRGPNDEYINHIMNVTGATVILKGLGSGHLGSPDGGDMEKPLHLLLSANNGKSLEDAKCLAENLMETICGEFIPHRIVSSSLCNVIPSSQSLPPPAQNPGTDHSISANMPVGTALLIPSIAPSTATSLVACSTQGTTLQSRMISVPPPSNLACYTPPLVTGKTCYNGYGGIYPQETPLQQVALALRQSSSLIASTTPMSPAIVVQSPNQSSSLLLDKEKQPAQKRKFQELTATSKINTEFSQGFELLIPSKSVKMSSNRLSLLPPPPPPKFTAPLPLVVCKEAVNKEYSESILPVSDTLVKLMEYGEEDDYPEEINEDSMAPRNSCRCSCYKPFWAV